LVKTRALRGAPEIWPGNHSAMQERERRRISQGKTGGAVTRGGAPPDWVRNGLHLSFQRLTLQFLIGITLADHVSEGAELEQ